LATFETAQGTDVGAYYLTAFYFC